MGEADDRTIDYAVIGGGIGGVYSAWRLKQAMPDKRVALFEYSDRIGGKLFSVALPGMPHVYSELGGMRYIPATQPLVTFLVERELELPVKDFPMGSPPPVGNTRNFVYLRRTHLYNEQLDDPDVVPYRLDWIEQGQSPNDLTSYVLDLLVPEYEKLDFDEWFDVTAFGRYLWEWGYWNLLYRVLSPDAFSFLRDGVGYDTNVANGNAVNLMFTAGDTSGEDHYKTLVHGYESLPRALADQYRDKLQGEVHMNARLASISKDGGSYRLDFEKTKTTSYVTEGSGEYRHEQAEHVILALPRRSIELIDWEPKQTDSFLKENLGSVIMQTAFKLFLGYPTPWWKALGLEAGRSLTDMPIRQTYYFGTEGAEPNSEEVDNLNSLLMASYNDLATVPFWKGLERGAKFAGDPDNPWLNGKSPVLAGAITPTAAIVEEAHKQILEVHAQRDIPAPYTAAFMDWGQDPFGGGWHSWKAGYRYNEIMPRMRHPVQSEKVYICGAAYSSDQGWVEGALETAEQMLTDNLGIGHYRGSKGWEHDPLKNLKHKLTLGQGADSAE